MALDMYGPMTGPSAWMMTGRWDWPHIFLLVSMWAVMMTGMMLPSAAPMLLLYATVARRRLDSPVLRVYALAAGYLVVWALFSVFATGTQRALSHLLVLSPMMVLQSRVISAALLVIAGIYQLTPLKRACLTTCRSPVSFLARHWRADTLGAFRMGLAHGLYCLGCCWALMLLLFVGGVMNLYVISALTVFVLLEKLAPLGIQAGRLSGGLLIATGVWLTLR
jgi:predicted metal-binding membrane protein